MNAVYASSLAAVVVAIIAAWASYATNLSQALEALKRIEILERLLALPADLVRGEDIRHALNSLQKDLNSIDPSRFTARRRRAIRSMLGAILALALIQATYIATFGPDPGFRMTSEGFSLSPRSSLGFGSLPRWRLW